MLQFVLIVKKTKSRLVIGILPVVLWAAHQLLTVMFEVIPNPGVSFSVELPMIKMVSVIFLFGLLFSLLKRFDWSVYLVFVGGLINTVDRFLLGFVRDYFNLIFFYNNLADWVIFVGVVLYLTKFLRKSNGDNL